MKSLHTGVWPRHRTAPALALLLSACFISAPLGAAPYGARGYGAECGLDIQRSADEDAYYLEIRSDAAAAPEVAMQVRGRLLRLQARQGAEQRTASCRTRFYKSLTLPRDADPGQIQRQDQAGRVLIIIPRRESYWR